MKRNQERSSSYSIGDDAENFRSNVLSLRYPVVKMSIWGLIAFLSFANFVALYVMHGLGHPEVWGAVPLFLLDREQNVPTLFASLLILACAALFYINMTFERERSMRSGWLFSSLIMVVIAVDEFVSIHERVDAALHAAFEFDGIWERAWVLPYFVLVLVVSARLFGWLLKLPFVLRMQLIAAGFIYIAGAMGVELLGGLFVGEPSGPQTNDWILTADLLASLEEILELTAIALLLSSLFGRVCGPNGQIELKVWARAPD